MAKKHVLEGWGSRMFVIESTWTAILTGDTITLFGGQYTDIGTSESITPLAYQGTVKWINDKVVVMDGVNDIYLPVGACRTIFQKGSL
jgi:hypothetical protein